MNLKTLSALAGSIMMLLTALPIMADDVSYQQARALREAGVILPLERIIEIAKTIKAGEVIDTDLEEDDGLYEYEIEILDTHGRVWEMEFDAATGELMKLELDD